MAEPSKAGDRVDSVAGSEDVATPKQLLLDQPGPSDSAPPSDQVGSVEGSAADSVAAAVVVVVAEVGSAETAHHAVVVVVVEDSAKAEEGSGTKVVEEEAAVGSAAVEATAVNRTASANPLPTLHPVPAVVEVEVDRASAPAPCPVGMATVPAPAAHTVMFPPPTESKAREEEVGMAAATREPVAHMMTAEEDHLRRRAEVGRPMMVAAVVVVM